MRSNEAVSAAFNEIADLLELTGGDRFRIVTYRRAADAVATHAADVGGLSERELVGIRGVGKSVASKIREFVETGTLTTLESLRSRVPEGVRTFTRLPGLGPKRAYQLHKDLGVSTLDELRAAAEDGRIESIKGLGPKVQEEILRALRAGELTERRVLLYRALQVAETIVSELATFDVVQDAAFAGSLRRMRETIGDVDILVSTDQPGAVMDAFRSVSHADHPAAGGDTKATVVTSDGLQVDLRAVEPVSFGSAMQYFTGSQAHNVKVRERAVKMGLKLSEYGLDRGDERMASATEEEVYRALGLTWIPPTMREDRGEVEAASRGELPRVVQLEDIRGDLQSHSTYSDGKTTIRNMATAASELGYEYYAVTDHGRNLAFMRSMSLEDIAAQRDEIAAINKDMKIAVLHGVELNIDADGGLDYPDDVLAGFDVIVASVHSHFKASPEEQTRRVVRAMEHPLVNVFGHPTGRRLTHREPIRFDFETVAKAAIANNVALEVNGHPHRLDLKDDHVRWAMDLGAHLVISTDAHSPAELRNMRFGVGTAQRGWATPDRVINTWPLERLRGFLAKN